MVGGEEDDGNAAGLGHVQPGWAGEDVGNLSNGEFCMAPRCPRHDGLSYMQGRDSWSDGLDDARRLAAQRGRKGPIHIVPEPPLDIGVVHGGGHHFEQDLVGLRGWQGEIFVAHHFWAAECMDSRRFHVDSSFPSPLLCRLLISRRGRSSAWPRLLSQWHERTIITSAMRARVQPEEYLSHEGT